MKPACLEGVWLKSVSRLIRIQGIGIQAYSGAPSEWDREQIITPKAKLLQDPLAEFVVPLVLNHRPAHCFIQDTNPGVIAKRAVEAKKHQE